MKKFLYFIFIIFSSFSYSNELDDLLNWNLILGGNNCHELIDEAEKINSSILDTENLSDFEILKNIINFKCAKDLDDAINLFTKLEKLIFQEINSERHLIKFSFFAQHAIWAHLADKKIEDARKIYIEILSKIQNLLLESYISIPTALEIIRPLNGHFRTYDYDEDYYQGLDYLEIFIFGYLNISTPNKDYIAKNLLDIRIDRLKTSYSNKNIKRILSELNLIFSQYFYGHKKRNFQYLEFYNYFISESGDNRASLLEKNPRFFDEAKITMSFSSEQIESLIDSLIHLNLSGVNFDKSYLLKIDRQVSFFEISEKKFEFHQSLISAAYYDFGKNTSKTLCNSFFKSLLSFAKKFEEEDGYLPSENDLSLSLRITILKNGNFCKDIKPYDSLADVNELRNRDWHFERLIMNFEDEKDEIQKKISYATNSSVEERYEKSDSFSIGKEFELLTDTLLVIYGDVTATTESFEKGIKRLLRILEIFPDQTPVREAQSLASYNMLLSFVDINKAKIFSSIEEQKKFLSLKKNFLEKIDQKFFFDLNGLTENIKNAKKYGSSMEFYGKLVANFLGYKFKNLIENPFALNSMGIYSLVNASPQQIIDMKDLISDYEALLIAIFKQSWKEFNLDREKTSLYEPLIFNHKSLDLSYLNVWFLYYFWMNELIDDLSVMDDLKFPKSWLNDVYENTFVTTLFTTSHTKLTYAFFYNYLKDLKENSKYVKEFEEYFKAYRQFNQFREEQINLKNPDEESKLKLTQLAGKAIEKESEIRNLNVEMGQFVFPELKIEDYKALLNDDEAILVILKSREQGPSMQLYIESNLARIMPSGWDFERYKKHIDDVLLDIEQRNIAGLNLLSILKLKEMYTHFLGPINDTKKVYVVIDEDFSKIPFSLFIDEDGRFAAEKHSFVVLDSLVSFKFLKKSKKKLNSKMSFVGIGNPTLDGSSKNNSFENLFTSRGFADVDKIKQLSNLPETKNELEEISSIFSSSILFMGQDASEDILKSEDAKKIISKGDIISFATHTFSDETNFSKEQGLVLTPPKIATMKNDGLLTGGEIAEFNLKDSLIILSACNTDKPIFESAGAYSGLPRLFIESGAGSVLTTQWNIDSYSAKLFVSETLSLGAKNGLSLSEALKNTMSRFINGFYGETFKHPFYWAPYVLVGEN